MLFALASVALARPEFHLEASSQLLPETVALDVRGRMDGERDAYLLAAARIDPSGCWIGRTGIGFDVFGGAEGFDLKLGLFLGGVGNLSDPSMYGRPAAGAEALIGFKIRRVYAYYRHIEGFAGPLEDRLTEGEARLGFVIDDHWRVHGQALFTEPGDNIMRAGAGVGTEVVF